MNESFRRLRPLVRTDADVLYEAGPYGILSLKHRGAKVTSETIYRLLEEEEMKSR